MKCQSCGHEIAEYVVCYTECDAPVIPEQPPIKIKPKPNHLNRAKFDLQIALVVTCVLLVFCTKCYMDMKHNMASANYVSHHDPAGYSFVLVCFATLLFGIIPSVILLIRYLIVYYFYDD